MAVLKCKMCGGDLEINSGDTVCECEYCGSKQTIPTADDEKKMKLFDRANRLRMNGEFDKAAAVYESIVSEFPEEAEGYWGNLLCAYGIEYVDDPATGNKIPTCHRSSFNCFLDEEDFEQVMENADGIARSVYREQAKQIEEIRKGIIEVSGKEQPYDIFICYKETAENGERTIDSVLAQDVYDALIRKGYLDSAQQVEICKDTIKEIEYNKAVDLMNSSQYEEAIQIFRSIETYKDCRDRIYACEKGVNDNDYQAAVELMNTGHYLEAVDALKALSEYRDSSDLIRRCLIEYRDSLLDSTITLGHYEQDNNSSNGTESLEWIVLEKTKDKALVLSKYAIDCKPFSSYHSKSNWTESDLRYWLNADFLNCAFTKDEQERILEEKVAASENPMYKSSYQGKDTQDKIFLLSALEARKYIDNTPIAQCMPTQYAVSRGAYVNPEQNCWWWLRTMGIDAEHATCYSPEGELITTGNKAASSDLTIKSTYIGIRPAIWIKID